MDNLATDGWTGWGTRLLLPCLAPAGRRAQLTDLRRQRARAVAFAPEVDPGGPRQNQESSATPWRLTYSASSRAVSAAPFAWQTCASPVIPGVARSARRTAHAVRTTAQRLRA